MEYKIKHDIDKEMTLINLLGYSLKEVDDLSWKIFDDDEEVGSIQFKRTRKPDRKKGPFGICGYKTVIDSKDIYYKDSRDISDYNARLLKVDNYGYSFDIKRDYGTDRVEISKEPYPSITIWSKKYGDVNFIIDDNGLSFDFETTNDLFKIKESVSYETPDYKNHKYTFSVTQTNIDRKESIGSTIYGEELDNDIVKTKKEVYFNGELVKSNSTTFRGKLTDLISNASGIDSFNNLRNLLKEILPFKEDIIPLIIDDKVIKRRELYPFISETKKSDKVYKK